VKKLLVAATAASALALAATTQALPITPGGHHSGHANFRTQSVRLSKHQAKHLIVRKFFRSAPFTDSPNTIRCHRRSSTKVHCHLSWKTNWNQGGIWQYHGEATAHLFRGAGKVRLQWHYNSHRIS
jgi:hypothetical protein